jgi:hypothetical protein
MMPKQIIHWCTFHEEPLVRLACGQEYTLRFSDMATPPGVHGLVKPDGDSVLYTFDPDLATCPDCKALQ